MRKTISLAFLIERTNRFLADSSDEMDAERRGMIALLESALFETGTYKGFRYLSSELNDDGSLILESEGLDESRREYSR